MMLKFEADKAGDLSKGTLYAMKVGGRDATALAGHARNVVAALAAVRLLNNLLQSQVTAAQSCSSLTSASWVARPPGASSGFAWPAVSSTAMLLTLN